MKQYDKFFIFTSSFMIEFVSNFLNKSIIDNS